MPRCQRSFQRLGNDTLSPAAADAAVWRCANCDERESYAVVTDSDLLAYARLAEAQCFRDFGAPPDRTRRTVLIQGLWPECVLELGDRRYDIYLQRESDPFQLRLQIGHEVFHRTCSRGRIFHWTHEMLACLFSVRLLRENGLADYADEAHARYRIAADEFSIEDLMATDLWNGGRGDAESGNSTGFYGRAYLTGVALANAVGYPVLCRLPHRSRRDGTPDVPLWLNTLPADAVAKCSHIFGITTGTSK